MAKKTAKSKAPEAGKPKSVKVLKETKSPQKKTAQPKSLPRKANLGSVSVPPLAGTPDARVLDRLWSTVLARKDADPDVSHSARLLGRGVGKVAQKFGEEAVECLIEAVTGNRGALIAESADVLYHLLVMWVAAGLRPEDVWAELVRREGISGITEKAGRPMMLSVAETRKIP
ncbi:MAG TPA: phosphoribosyl-ATP diphosphatase [Acetobacteraceae bacterium]|nr:phosphoribosyl-ATP diphosphatase [Acetobacteraceae bacterium]